MKKITIIAICLFSNMLFAHTINYDKVILRHWKIEKENKTIDGSFFMYKNGNVFIEDANNVVVHFPIASFSKEDQTFALTKNKWVEELNKSSNTISKNKVEVQNFFDYKFWITSFILVFLSLFIFFFIGWLFCKCNR